MKSDSMRTPPWKIFIIMSFFGGLSGKLQDGIANKRYIPRKVLVIESNTDLEILEDPRSFYERHKGRDFYRDFLIDFYTDVYII